MSYLLETLGRGLLGELLDAFRSQLPRHPNDDPAELRARLADAPASPDVSLRLGLALLRRGRPLEAQPVLRRALAAHPQARGLRLALACAADQCGRLEEALHDLSNIQRDDPRDPSLSFALGLGHERLGQRAAARDDYERAAAACPRLRNAHERLAAIAVREQRWVEAVQRYDTLAELDPGDLDIQLALGGLLLADRQPRRAVETFQKALLIEPECTEDTLRSVTDLSSAGRTDQALEAARQLIDQYPGVPELHVYLADLYVRVGDDQGALRHYRESLALHPGFLEATVKLGTQHLRQGRYTDAARTFSRAVELSDRLLLAFVGLAVAQAACGRNREAESTLDLAAGLEPNSTLLLTEAARLQLRCQDSRPERTSADEPWQNPDDGMHAAWEAGPNASFEDVLVRFEQALAQRPAQADLHYRRGVLLRQAGDTALATEAFAQAVAIHPPYTRALIRLGLCQRESGRCSQAMRTLVRAVRPDPSAVDAAYELGLLFVDAPRFQLALERLERQLDVGFKPCARENLALALEEIGLVDRSGAAWQSVAALDGEADALADRADSVGWTGEEGAG